jgi:hypothetical protein
MTTSEITVERLPHDSIIEMARGIVLGERYLYPAHALETGAPMFFLFIRFAPGEIEKVGMVVGERTRAVRTINGHPACMSGWIVHRDDVPAVQAKLNEYHKALGIAGQEVE